MSKTTTIIESKQVDHPVYGLSTVSLVDYAYGIGLRLCIVPGKGDSAGKTLEYPMPSEAEGRRLMAKLS